MVCLDTSVLIPIIRKDRHAIERLVAESDKGSSVSTTIVNVCELYGGAYRAKDSQRELEKLDRAISALRILNLNERAARRYGMLVSNDSLKKSPIGDFDLLISCIAMELTKH